MRAARIAGLLAGAAAAVSAFSLAANAETSASIRLTPAQTVALYGSSIQMKLDNSTDVYFQYVGTSKEYVGSGAYGQEIPVLSIAGVSSNNETYYKTILNQAEYVYYHYQAPNWQFSNTTRFTATLSPMLSGITGYDGNFIFSFGGYNSAPTNFTQRSTVLFNTTQGQKTFYTETGFVSAAVGYTALEPVSEFGTVSDSSKLAFTFTSMYGDNSVMFSQQPQYDLDAITITWASAGGITHSAVTGGNTDLYFAIQCPKLTNYVPPVVTTTTPPVTTRRQYTVLPPVSTAPAQTVDLSNLESGVAAIVEQEQEMNNNLEWIGSNIYIGVNNLAYICNRLDDIYRDMVKSGELPANLFPVDGTLLSGIQNGLTSYTTARIPDDAQAGLSFWAWVMSYAMKYAWFSGLCTLGAFLAVTYFILFRGRNS